MLPTDARNKTLKNNKQITITPTVHFETQPTKNDEKHKINIKNKTKIVKYTNIKK